MSDWSSHVFSSDLGARVLDGRDLLGSIVGDFDAEFFLERHHQLDDVQAVSAQIVDEARILGHLFGFDAQMLDDDFLYAIRGLTHEWSFLLGIVDGSEYLLRHALEASPTRGKRQEIGRAS